MSGVEEQDPYQQLLKESKLREQPMRDYICETLDLPTSNLPWTNFNKEPELSMYNRQRIEPVCSLLKSVFNAQPAFASEIKKKIWYFCVKLGISQTGDNLEEVSRIFLWYAKHPEDEFLFVTQKHKRPYALYHVRFKDDESRNLIVKSFISEGDQMVKYPEKEVFDILAGYHQPVVAKKSRHVKVHPEINSPLYFQEEKSTNLGQFLEKPVTGLRVGVNDSVTSDKEKVMAIITLSKKRD